MKRFRAVEPAFQGLIVLSMLLAGCLLHQDEARMDHEEEQDLQPGDHERTLTVDGRKRSYILHVPEQRVEGEALPLVVVLHGGGGNGRNAMTTTGMAAKADEAGFVAAFPNGSGMLNNRLLTWNAGRCCAYAMRNQVDDVAFVRALIQDARDAIPIDERRIYATGASNGAMMTYRLACELSDQIAAVAPVSGYLAFDGCAPGRPMPVMIFHGTADEYVPYDGGTPKKQPNVHAGPVSSVADAVSFWVQHNACSTTPERHEEGSIVREVYGGGLEGSEVVLYTINGGGHAWPGGQKGREQGDEPTQEISATELMWEFFQRHSRS
jgi:polyhydroxybutyrate depolymerase